MTYAPSPETVPSFTYAEGNLTFTIPPYPDVEITDRQQTVLDRISEDKGITLIPTDSTTTVNVDVQTAFGNTFNHYGSRGDRVGNFLSILDSVLPYSPRGTTDHVLYPYYMGDLGIGVGVYSSFQRWLNAQNHVDETMAREVVTAMATPFGRDTIGKAQKHFRLIGNYNVDALLFRFSIVPSDFDIYRTDQHLANATQREYGKVVWNNLDISTLGDCACLGASGDERERVNVSRLRPHQDLYRMSPYNIDFGRQTLSLLMGMGVMTHRAANYAGREDILAGASWYAPSK